jgi:hypothetical protein
VLCTVDPQAVTAYPMCQKPGQGARAIGRDAVLHGVVGDQASHPIIPNAAYCFTIMG